MNEMNTKYMDFLKVSTLGVLSGLIIGCGASSSSDSSSESTINLPTAVGQPLPSGVIAYEELASGVYKLLLSGNEFSGQTVLWETVDVSGNNQTPLSLFVADYDSVSGWGTAESVKTDLRVSEVELSHDSLGDVHTSWFTPGAGIYAKSRINGVWQAENLLTTTGACLDMGSQIIGVGTHMIWCETGDLVGLGEHTASGWLNTGVINDGNGTTISGKESRFEALNNDNLLITWLAIEDPNNNQSPVNALHIGEFSGKNNVSDNSLAIMDVNVSSVNDVFTNGEDSHLLAWTDNSNTPNALNVSVFDGSWSLPVILNSVVDGYTDFDSYFLDNGDIIFLAEQFGRTMSIYYYNGSTWKTVDSINNVTSFDAVVLENELLLVYSADLETKGVRINAGSITSTAFNLAQPTSDIGIAKLDTDKVLIVWRDLATAFYAALQI
jgi:hypothetical protein